MTKADLIAALAGLPDNAKVFVTLASNPGLFHDITSVEIGDEDDDAPAFGVLKFGTTSK